jgi:hypothetical protein
MWDHGYRPEFIDGNQIILPDFQDGRNQLEKWTKSILEILSSLNVLFVFGLVI